VGEISGARQMPNVSKQTTRGITWDRIPRVCHGTGVINPISFCRQGRENIFLDFAAAAVTVAFH
jgi:hypothetical protein